MILLIDDDEIVRSFYKVILKRLGYDAIVEAGDGMEGVEKFSSNPISCVITDMAMPRMDGLGVIEALKGKGVPIVLISGKIVERPVGLDKSIEFIMKPITMDTFSDVIRRLYEPVHKDSRC